MFPISSCLRGVRSRADPQIRSMVVTHSAKTLEKCVGSGFAATAGEGFHGRETGNGRSFQCPTFFSGACKIQLYRSSPAQRVLLVGGWKQWGGVAVVACLDLEVQGKLTPLDGRGGFLFAVSSPALRASLKPEQSCALTWFLLSSASTYSVKKSSLLAVGTKLPGGAPGCDHSLPCKSLHRAPRSDQAL